MIHIPKVNLDLQAMWQPLLQWLLWVLPVTNNGEFGVHGVVVKALRYKPAGHGFDS